MTRVVGRRPVDAALVYAQRGWPVFPCHSATASGGCSCLADDCSSPGKHPRIAKGLKVATVDPEQVEVWWGRWPRANVAIRTGAESGLVVLDVDPDHGGEASLVALVEEHGELPPGRTVRTGSGGLHLYFRHPGRVVRNQIGRLGPGLDLRGDGGYVIAPPSRHVCGGRYRVLRHGGLLPPLPPGIQPAVARSRAQERTDSAPLSNQHAQSAWGRAALDGELTRLAKAHEGIRNDTLNRVAFRLGQVIGGGSLDMADVESTLIDRAAQIGLTEREASATVRSGLSAGLTAARRPDLPDHAAPELHR